MSIPAPRYVLALDQGTTSSRALLFDHDGLAVAKSQREFCQTFPEPGWVEHDAEEIWESQSAVAVEAMEKAGAEAGDVAAVGITNQRETTVLWDRQSGTPVGPAIVWQDRRTADFCAELEAAGAGKMIRAKTGLRLDPYFSGTKLRWLLDHIPGARDRAGAGELAFGTIDSWLAWNLTGGGAHVTDLSNASRTLLLNIHEQGWDSELLDLLEIPESVLPEVVDCDARIGLVQSIPALRDVPIAGMAGDQQAALFGQGCFRPGMGKCTYGTGCFLLLNTGDQAVDAPEGLLTTIAWKAGGETVYALEGSVFIGGAVVQWLRDGLGIIETAAEVDSLAESVDDTGGVFLVPAFAGLGAPHWDPLARGLIGGITRGTNAGHIARAALEGIGFQVADLVATMESGARIALRELRVDGGASRSQPLMQFQSDLLERPVIRPEMIETTALGAAYLAGLSTGFWNDRREITDRWQADATFQPEADAETLKQKRAGWELAVGRSRNWVS